MDVGSGFLTDNWGCRFMKARSQSLPAFSLAIHGLCCCLEWGKRLSNVLANSNASERNFAVLKPYPIFDAAKQYSTNCSSSSSGKTFIDVFCIRTACMKADVILDFHELPSASTSEMTLRHCNFWQQFSLIYYASVHLQLLVPYHCYSIHLCMHSTFFLSSCLNMHHQNT